MKFLLDCTLVSGAPVLLGQEGAALSYQEKGLESRAGVGGGGSYSGQQDPFRSSPLLSRVEVSPTRHFSLSTLNLGVGGVGFWGK